MKKFLVLLSVVAALTVAIGCAKSEPTPPPAAQPAPDQPATPAETPAE